MLSTYLLNATASGTTGGQTGGGIGQIVLLVGLLVIMYFVLIRPQQKRQKEEQKLRDSINVGDEVVTIGGICGRVVSVKDDSMVIETGSDKNKMRVMKWSVQQNLSAPPPEKKGLFGGKKKKKEDKED